MKVEKEVWAAMEDILKNYEFTKKEQMTIAMFTQTLLEYEAKA